MKEEVTAPSKLLDPVLASRTFGAYLALSGLTFFLVPGYALPILGLPAPGDEWIRVVGLLTMILGMYFVYCAQAEALRFFQATIIARLTFFAGVVSLVALGRLPPLLVTFGLVDLVGAAWTFASIRMTRRSPDIGSA